MKILVTGGAGQLGCSLRKVSVGYPNYEFIFVDLPEIDITDIESVEAIFEREQPDYVVNCAAYTAVDRAESEPDTAFRVNELGVENIANAARNYGAIVVHISTDYVYGDSLKTPLRENAATLPQSAYGFSKLAGEKALKGSGCKGVVVRTSWLYSEFGSNFVKTMLRIGAERTEVRVVDDQIGSPTYAVGLARAIMMLIDRGITGFEIYNYSDRGAVSWYDFAVEIFAQSAINVAVIPIPTCDYPTPAQRPAYSVMDSSKIAQSGVEIRDWRENLSDCIKEIAKI